MYLARCLQKYFPKMENDEKPSVFQIIGDGMDQIWHEERSGGNVAEHELDLRGVACPMNFVKTRLFLDKIQEQDILTVLLDAGEPVESVCSSVAAEGHQILNCTEIAGGAFSVSIKKDSSRSALEGTC